MIDKLRSIDYFLPIDHQTSPPNQNELFQQRTFDIETHPRQLKVGSKLACLDKLTLTKYEHVTCVRVSNLKYLPLDAIEYADAGLILTCGPRNHKGNKLLRAFGFYRESRNRRSRVLAVAG